MGEKVGEGVCEAVAVDVKVLDGIRIGVKTKFANASAVNAAAVFRFEKARLGISAASITIGVGRLGSESAIAEVAQNRLKPSVVAKKIHNSPL